MPEPKVEIPARAALLASKHLYHLSKIYPHIGLDKLSEELLNAVTEQICIDEINQGIVSARIQMANDYTPDKP